LHLPVAWVLLTAASMDQGRDDGSIRAKARARALRAARAVSIVAALTGVAACATSHDVEPPIADAATDAVPPSDGGRRDAGRDGGRRDAGPRDAGRPDAGLADAGRDTGVCPPDDWSCTCQPMSEECCNMRPGYYDPAGGCCVTCVVGPLVPPSMPV
jgi:hypothetical protein